MQKGRPFLEQGGSSALLLVISNFKNKMNRLIYIGVIAVCLTGCMSTKKYSAFVDEKIKSEKLVHEPKDGILSNRLVIPLFLQYFIGPGIQP
jgi:hypothetical protein